MIEFDKVFKIYLRFLKEEGVYQRVLSIHSKNRKLNAKKVLKNDTYFANWIQNEDTFCLWSSTKEGKDFWWIIHLLWLIKCSDFYVNGHVRIDKSYVKISIESFLREFSLYSVENEQMKNIIIEKIKKLKKYIDYE